MAERTEMGGADDVRSGNMKTDPLGDDAQKANPLVTSRKFGRELQINSRISISIRGNGQSLDEMIANSAKVREETWCKFDKIYKPYILYRLERDFNFGWKDGRLCKGSIDGEDIYHDVVAALLGGTLWRFNFSAERVGKGAFRSYLIAMVRSAYINRVKPDLIPVFDTNGDPVYTDTFKKDKDGKIKKDKYGHPIRKQKMMTPIELTSEQYQSVRAQGPAIRKEDRVLSWFLCRLAQLAYLDTIEKLCAKGRTAWKPEAMRAVFEDLESIGSVIERFMREGKIADRQTFDTAKSVFLSNMRKKWDALCKPIITRERTQEKNVYLPRLNVTEEEAKKHIAGLEEEAERRYGKERVDKTRRNFAKAMLTLMQEEDDRVAEKNAKFYQ